MIKVSLKEILKSDVGILNKYFLVTLIIVLLTIVGYTSYALFSYEEVSNTGIRLKYSGEIKQSVGNLSTNWKDKTENETSYLAIYTLDNVNFPSTYNYDGTTYTLSTTIDVSEQENGNVLLTEYKNGSNYIAIFGQDKGVVAPVDSSGLFSIWYSEYNPKERRPEGYLYSDLEYIDLSKFNTKHTTDMSYMFGGGGSKEVEGHYLVADSYLKTIVFGKNFSTLNVTNMSHMFSDCSSLTALDLASFDTRNVTDMTKMFYYCSGLTMLDLTSFNTKNATDMSYMFFYCSSLTSITVGCNWKTDNVITMESMFSGSTISEVTKVCNE